MLLMHNLVHAHLLLLELGGFKHKPTPPKFTRALSYLTKKKLLHTFSCSRSREKQVIANNFWATNGLNFNGLR